MSVHTPIETGSEFAGYRLEELIGQGGMGVVYRASDLRLKRTVALKLVAPELAADERFHARFARESELAMSLEHANVVPIYDAGESQGRLYLAMRLVEGTDLRALLRASGPLDAARALAICGQVADALDAAHAKGLVHRDVKPSNVLLDADGHVYLADFGLTRRLDEQGAQPGDGRSLGTPAYVAPEQIDGATVDGRADVYSLGCLLYECIVGEAPFVRESPLAVAWAHLEEEPPSASMHNADLPKEVDAVIRKAMAKSPDDRHPTCAALLAAAEGALGLQPTSIGRPRRLHLLVGAAILVALGGAVATALVVRDDGPTTASVPVVAPNTLVRIDARTNTVSDVIGVGTTPSVAAVSGKEVWVYNRGDSTISEIDATANEVRETTHITGKPIDLGFLTGPVLAADPDGAWIAGVDGDGKALLTRVLSHARGKREYPLDHEPRAVAVGEGAVWVLGHGTRDDQVLRFDPATGALTARTRFPTSSRLSSLAVGLGGVWVVSSSSATLYRIDPRTAALTGQRDLGQRAGRPNVQFGRVWVGVSDAGGMTLLVDPRTLRVAVPLDCCALGDGYDAVNGYGSTWTTDWQTGTVVRWDGATYEIVAAIRVTDPPFYEGSCMTSIAAGGGAVWVTVAPNSAYACAR